MECWSVGVLECWSVGVLECWSVEYRAKSQLHPRSGWDSHDFATLRLASRAVADQGSVELILKRYHELSSIWPKRPASFRVVPRHHDFWGGLGVGLLQG